MHKIFRVGPYSVAINFWGNNVQKKVLEDNHEKDYKIIRSEPKDSNIRELTYSWIENGTENSEGRERAFIRGYFEQDDIFYMHRVKNTLRDRWGILFLPHVLNVMEKDLKKEGVVTLRSNFLKRLVPSCKRFGFEPYENGKKKHWLEYIHPLKLVPLEKRLV